MLPLTSSLYVKGKVATTEHLLVNVGTDYYVEVSLRRRLRQLPCMKLGSASSQEDHAFTHPMLYGEL